MKTIRRCLFILLMVHPAMSQWSDLVLEHGQLTTDCKMIRGHSKRIVQEASALELNTSVALAHLGEVMKSLVAMERRLQQTKKLSTANQLKTVSAEYAALEKICARLKDLSEELEAEFAKSRPDKHLVRKLASDLQAEMTIGSDYHSRMKAKLGIK